MSIAILTAIILGAFSASNLVYFLVGYSLGRSKKSKTPKAIRSWIDKIISLVKPQPAVIQTILAESDGKLDNGGKRKHKKISKEHPS
jgi:hypothetical protein